MAEAMTTKAKAADIPHRNKPKHIQPEGPIVVDLHINEILDNTAGLSNADILERQLDEFRSVMNQNIRQKGSNIIFIHGKGEGVLRKAILTELKRHYPKCEAQDASFREYGFGATRITIH
jgi:dsDNA-specific endonuclease/ATPase MutS2